MFILYIYKNVDLCDLRRSLVRFHEREAEQRSRQLPGAKIKVTMLQVYKNNLRKNIFVNIGRIRRDKIPLGQ